MKCFHTYGPLLHNSHVGTVHCSGVSSEQCPVLPQFRVRLCVVVTVLRVLSLFFMSYEAIFHYIVLSSFIFPVFDGVCV